MEEEKLQTLAEDWGYENPDAMIADTFIDSVSPGICMNERCDYSTEIEPDSREGWCELCGTQSVTSAQVLAGFL